MTRLWAARLRGWQSDEQIRAPSNGPLARPSLGQFVFADTFKAARDVAGILARDDAGRVVDFHALRHTFIINLAVGGVHPKKAQTLARHSTITLTMDRYTHQVAEDEREALAVLSDLTVPAAAVESYGN